MRFWISAVGAPSPTGMVTTGFLPSRDTCTSLYIVGEGREQEAEASPALLQVLQFCSSIFFLAFKTELNLRG